MSTSDFAVTAFPGTAADEGGGFARLYRAFLAARAALAFALVLLLAGARAIGSGPQPLALALCAVYALLTLTHAALPRLTQGWHGLARLDSPRWWASIGLDLAVFTLLQALDGGGGLSIGALYFMPVLMAGVLAPRRAAMAVAAMATLGLLGALFWSGLTGADLGPRLMQAGLAGTGYFVVALMAAELAARLAREEIAAKGSAAYARQQAALNQLVIDEMQEGVLVVDRALQVRAANPAARMLLGEHQAIAEPSFPLTAMPAWIGLVDAVDAAFHGQIEVPGDVNLSFARAPARALRVRSRVTRGRESDRSEDLCVLLLEDRATLLARLRRDKLAAMGRMSAGIAHEIRNPLAAISQANALLGEDLPDAGAQRLTSLVAANVKRLQRIVDEVMVLAAAPFETPPPVDALALVSEVCEDWERTQGLPAGLRLRTRLPEGPQPVLFDPDHLRRVLVNLLDNAWRHAQEAAQAPDAPPDAPWIALWLEHAGPESLRLRVFNPGPSIAPDVERHLFEPFYSTRSRGSGLGLYICRELCERYRARIDYLALAIDGVPGNAFDVRLRVAAVQNAVA